MMAVLMANFFKYVMLGMSISICSFYLPNLKADIRSIIYIGLVAALTFYILDLGSEATGKAARFGAGAGIGMNLVGAGQMMPMAALGAAGAM